MTDDLILHYLQSRGGAQPPIDLVGSVVDAVTDAPQQRASRFAPLIPVAAALGAAAAVVAVAILLQQPPEVGPTPSQSASMTSSAPASPPPSDRPEAIGDVLLEPGDIVEMPAIDGSGEWGVIRLERGDEVVPTDPGWSTYEEGSVIIEIHVRYTAERSTGEPFGDFDWGLRLQDGVPDVVGPDILPATSNPDRVVATSLGNQTSMTEGSAMAGWIALEVPIVDESPAVLLTYQGGERPSGASQAPTWEVLVRERDRNAPPTAGGDLLQPGDAAILPAVGPDGPFGTITLDRGHDVGGYPLVLSPSSTSHFFVEIFATYELNDVPGGAQWGDLDWRMESEGGTLGVELVDAFPPVRGRVGLGQWPGATVPQTHYSGWMIFAVPRETANTNLQLVYQPAGIADATRIPVRSPGEAPAPVAAEWPRPDPVYVAQNGLPITVLESSEADTLFVDADTCTNPDGGYTVTYPDSWYTNTALDNVPACSWFSPTYFDLNESGDLPEEIAIEIRVFEGAVGFIWADLYSEQITLDDFTARRFETGKTKDPETPTDEFQYDYLVALDVDSEGRKLWAFTGTDHGGEYELNKAVFDRIMASLQWTESSP